MTRLQILTVSMYISMLITTAFGRMGQPKMDMPSTTSVPAQRRNLRGIDIETIECTIYEIEYEPSILIDGNSSRRLFEEIEGEELIPSEYECVDDSDEETAYSLIFGRNTTAESIFESSVFEDVSSIESGVTRIQVPSTIVSELGYGYIMDLSLASRRKMQILSENPTQNIARAITEKDKVVKEGDRTVAVIRVTSADGSPTRTATELSDDIFGTDGDVYNLKSGYSTCSGNKLNFFPGTENGLIDGVLELTISNYTSGVESRDVQKMVNKALGKDGIGFPSKSYDHVMYVFPSNVDFGSAGGYAVVSGRLSVYKDTYASDYAVVMHEIGHNLGLHHSGKGGKIYGDTTCMLGAHIRQDEGPAMCFNGAKSWYFGFYDDRHYEIEPSMDTGNIQLVGIDDYMNGKSNADEHAVVMRLHGENENVFVMYNQAKGINAGVVGRQNAVTIVEQEGPHSQSWLLDDLKAGEVFRKENWAGSDNDLVIEVCSMEVGSPDYAHVIAYVEGVSHVSCGSSLPPPTDSSNVKVSFYNVGKNWKKLPSKGLKSLSEYKTSMVGTIDYPKETGEFVEEAEQEKDVAALFEGSLSFPTVDDGEIVEFCLTSDDGSKLSIDGTEIIDLDGLHNIKTECGSLEVLSSTEIYLVEVEFFKKGKKPTIILEMKLPNESSFSTIPATAWEAPGVLPGDEPEKEGDEPDEVDESESEDKVKISYYEISGWNELPSREEFAELSSYQTEMISTIHFPTTSGKFGNSGRKNNVAAFIEGNLQFPSAGETELCISSSDGSKLYLDGELFIDNDGVRKVEETKCASIDVTDESQVYALEVEYFDKKGDSTLLFTWKVPVIETKSVSAFSDVPATAWV